MKAAVETLADEEQLGPELRIWRDDVRELTYDMEDCVDDFGARIDSDPDESTGLKRFFCNLKKLKPCHEIGDEIHKLKARAIETSERHKRYTIVRPTPNSSTCSIDPRLHALYEDVDRLVGINGPKRHIIEWFRRESSSTQLKVVSIVGPGALGKTTLANEVYHAMKIIFSCGAFVSVSRKPDLKNVLRDIARRVGVTGIRSTDDERQIIDSIRDHLQDKTTSVEFEEGSMPKLEHLKLDFPVHNMGCLINPSDFGIQHLSALTKVDVNMRGETSWCDDLTADKFASLIRTAVGTLPKCPTLSFKQGCDLIVHQNFPEWDRVDWYLQIEEEDREQVVAGGVEEKAGSVLRLGVLVRCLLHIMCMFPF
ncbi:hypothetical protein ACQ4PT_047874 [Festuca glaucescens]